MGANWADSVAELAEVLRDAIAADDWAAALKAARIYLQTLQSMPLAARATAHPLLLDAQQMIAELLARAQTARDSTVGDLKQLQIGRKAIAAYK